MNTSHSLAAAAALVLACTGVSAQFKVVGPDGKVTYSDRPSTAGKLTQVKPATGASVDSTLPFALRGVAERFPVTLYTSTDCGEACAVARTLLKQRGIPHRERTVDTNEDRVAFQQLGVGSMLPLVRVGGQVHAGFNDSEWNNTLNLAGYPARSALPANYKGVAPSPLGDRPTPAVAAAPAPEPVRTEVQVDRNTNPSGIRF
jgi:glutaredoxin